MSIDRRLRDTLHGVADELGSVEPVAAVRAEGMLAMADRRSRRRAAVLSAGLTVLLLAVLVPVGLSLVRGAEGRDTTERGVAAPPPAPGTVPDIYGGPTRGSLAGDAAFVQAVRQLSWTTGVPLPDDGVSSVPDPAVDARRVVFVGDVAAGRWALVVGDVAGSQAPTGQSPAPEQTADPTRPTDPPSPDGPVETSPSPGGPVETSPPGAFPAQETGLAAAWFVGPPGATPAQMELLGGGEEISLDQPASLYEPRTGSLVVVAAVGDAIEVSPRTEVAADATVSRNFLDTGTSDGVLATALEPNPYNYGTSVKYRVTRDGVVLAEQDAHWFDSGQGGAYEPPAISYLRPPVEGTRGEANSMAYDILGEYGLLPDQLDLQVHYVGFVPSVAGTRGVLTVLTATFPSGAVLTRAQASVEAPGDVPVGYSSYGAGVCTSTLSPAGAPAAQRIVALRCDVEAEPNTGGPAGRTSTLVIVAPPDLADGYAVAEGSSGPITLDLADGGIGMAPFPDGAQSVVIHAADGAALEEVPILTA